MASKTGSARALSQTNVLVFEPDSTQEMHVYRDALLEAFPQLKVHCAPDMDAAMTAPASEIVIAKGVHLTQPLVDRMPNLAWVHSLISGEDHVRALRYPTRPVITATRGVHGIQVSELALLLMMSTARDMPGFFKGQMAEDWKPRSQPVLAGKTALIVGLGQIAEHLAKMLAAMGMSVDAVSNGRSHHELIRKIYPRDALEQAVRHADFVIALIPLSPQTEGIFNRAIFAAMKPSAYFINVARGGVADESDLVAALRAGEIAGAGIDACSIEPLPKGHKLWDAPNVIITPHVGGRSDTYAQTCAPVLIDAARAFFDNRDDEMKFRIDI